MKKCIVSLLMAVMVVIEPCSGLKFAGLQVSPITVAYAAEENGLKTEFDKTIIFKDDETFEAELLRLNSELLPKYKEASLNLDTNEAVLNWTELYDECMSLIWDFDSYTVMDMYMYEKSSSIAEKSNRVYAAKNNFNIITNSAIAAFKQKDKEFLEGLLSDERLSPWHRFINDLLLSDEELLSERDNYMIMPGVYAGNMIVDQYYAFRDSDLVFEPVEAPDGTMVPSNYTNRIAAISDLEHPEFADAMNKAFYRSMKNYENTFAGYLNSFVYLSEALAERYGYSSQLEMVLAGDGLDEESFGNFIEAASSSLDEISDLANDTEIQQNIVKPGQDKHKVIIVDNYDYDYDFEYGEARELLLNALAPLGDEYIKCLSDMFESGCIDVYPAENKNCDNVTFFGNIPCVLINYTDDFESVSTLSHELGHAVHLILSNKYQTGCYNKIPTLMTSEIASLTNELLLIRYMEENAKTDDERLFYLYYEYDVIQNNFSACVMLSEFEYKIHNIVKDGGTLTADVLNNEYGHLAQEFWDTDTEESDENISWASVSQLYTPYYSKDYAYSIAAACNIADEIASGDKQAVENYMQFLKSGDSMDPEELYALTGSDISDASFIQPLVNRLKVIINEVHTLEAN